MWREVSTGVLGLTREGTMAPGQGSRVGGRSPADEPYIVVSTDSHVGPSCKDQLREYCESKYLGDFDRLVTEM